MSTMFRFVLFLLLFLSVSQTWGVSVSPHQYDAKSVIFAVDAYAYDAPLNLRTCDNQCIESKAQDVNRGRFLALADDFLATKGTPQTLVERGADLVKRNAGKNRVSISTPNGRTNIDLAGKSHNVNGVDVPTPHVQNFKNNVIPSGSRAGQVGSRSKLGDTRPATASDLRTVDRFLKSQGR